MNYENTTKPGTAPRGSFPSVKLAGTHAVMQAPTLQGNIYLVGFMGSGKSTVGKALARRLAWVFHDTDRAIERRVKKSIPDIFAELGETSFRAIEREEIEKTARGRRMVVALGGGALLDYRNVQLIEKSGAVVYLRVSVDEALRRVEGAGVSRRPLLAGTPEGLRRKRISEMLAERRPLYKRAGLHVNTVGFTPEEIARRVAAKLFPPRKPAEHRA